MVLRHALIKIAKHGKELVKGYRSDASVQGRDEGLIILVQPVDDVGYELIILDWFSRRGELISEPPHGGEGGHRLVALLRVDQRRADVVDAAE